MSFYFINIETIENTIRYVHFFYKMNNFTVQLMSFYYMNVEIIKKCGYEKKMEFEKKNIATSPAEEFLLHPRRNRKKKNELKKKCTSPS